MHKIKIILAIMLAMPLQVFALADASAPTKMQIPFGNSAGGSYIRTVPVASQIGIQNGAASYTDGFPPLNFTPVNAGGVPPFGQDMNGILNAITSHTRWWAAGGPVYYDGTYQTAIGGYPKGACIQSATTTARIWCSTVDNNTSNPDTGGANWQFPTDAINSTNSTNSVNVTGSAIVTGAITSSSPSAGIGYATGACGAVTQTGTITTGVVLNKTCGQITTVSNSWTAGAYVSFPLQSTSISATDVVAVSLSGSAAPMQVSTFNMQAGIAYILINPMGTSGGTVTINFAVIKSKNN